jgi:cellulose synthase/poly-beta-1,6-N-acetylglucosamine synthase-like glycosyltransferase
MRRQLATTPWSRPGRLKRRMAYVYLIAGILLAVVWFSRIVDAALGMPSVADISRPEWGRNPVMPTGNPRVSIIVPARNEEGTIEPALRTLLALDYDNLEVIAVNDRSMDRTGEIMERLAAAATEHRLRVIHHLELPAGWLGKTHAMWTGAKEATGEWLLFTDADVLFKPDSVRRAVAYGEAEAADHVVLFPRMIMKRTGEFMMIAFFQSLFTFGHRPWKVANPATKDHIGVGAFNLVRRKVYEAVGTYAALRMEVVDDMKLGKVVKQAGFRQRNVFGADLISIYWVQGALGMVNNLTKNAFAILSFQWWRTLISVFGLLFLNVGPFLGLCLAHGWARLPFGIALGSMFLIYLGMSWHSDVPPYYLLLHPVATLMFCFILLRSMILTSWNDGIEWRGTKYPLEELRKGMV